MKKHQVIRNRLDDEAYLSSCVEKGMKKPLLYCGKSRVTLALKIYV